METKPSNWQRSATRRLLRGIFRWRTLIALAWVVTVIALCYAWINWTDSREWNNYRRNYEAHVASLDFRAYIPKEIPDSENFAATPFVRSWFNYKNTNFFYDHDAFNSADLRRDAYQWNRHEKTQGGLKDLDSWADAFAAGPALPSGWKNIPLQKRPWLSRAAAAQVILAGMKDDDAVMEELRAASPKPLARYQVAYELDNPWSILLPHLIRVKQSCRRLELRSAAELAIGETAQALKDISLIFYLGDTLKSEPFLISFLVRLSCVNLGLEAMREGLTAHQWNDAQLQQWQTRFETINFLEDAQRALNCERSCGVLNANLMKNNGREFADEHSMTELSDTALYFSRHLVPEGWYDEERLHYLEWSQRLVQDTVNVEAKRVWPDQIAHNSKELDAFGRGWSVLLHHRILAMLELSPLRNLYRQPARSQVYIDEAIQACALERYHLNKGQYPQTLQELVPSYLSALPNDVITGNPYKYHLTRDGKFILYSVGWDQKDDGGMTAKNTFDVPGDWVWQTL